jgi:Skp family chaperone for outer membrane proteins
LCVTAFEVWCREHFSILGCHPKGQPSDDRCGCVDAAVLFQQAQGAKEKTGDYAQAAQHKAGELTGAGKDKSGSAADSAKDAFGTVQDKAKSAADQAGSKVKIASVEHAG